MRVAIAILMAIALGAIGIGMLRSLAGRTPHAALPEPIEQPEGVRVTFWCENCGTELLLLRRGSEQPPRHCGEQMIRRDETAHG